MVALYVFEQHKCSMRFVFSRAFILLIRQDGKLYWCDARTDKIERIDLETGKNREVVLSNNNMDMFSVSVFEDYIYWSDR